MISACLLGVNCKYDGGNNRLPDETIGKLVSQYELIPVCPECYGGLTTPRTPSERLRESEEEYRLRFISRGFSM